jgi:hypothetical protein
VKFVDDEDILIIFILAQTTTSTTATNVSTWCVSRCRCTGISSYTQWQTFGSDAIYMLINTGNCNFTQTPCYFTSVSGTSSHWTMTGYNAIFSPTSSSFSVYLRGRSVTSSSTLLGYSSSYTWNVNWGGMYN